MARACHGGCMEKKKILIAVDSSENSERAVAYVGDMLGGLQTVEICLLYIERPPDRDIYSSDEAWEDAARAREESIRIFLKKARNILEKKGITAGRIREEYVVSCKSAIHESPGYCATGTSIAKEILRVRTEGGFTTIVIGRRGVSRTEEFLFGSVSSSVMHTAGTGTIWVVA